MYSSFADALHDLRMKAGYTKVSQLARACGISQATLSRIQNGIGTPTPETLKKMAPYLGKSYEELMRLAGHLPGVVKEDSVNWEIPTMPHPIEVSVFSTYNPREETGKWITGEYVSNEYGGKCIFLLVDDNNMELAGIRKNDMVLIDPELFPDNGDIVAYSLRGSNLKLARYFRSGDFVHLFEEYSGSTPEYRRIEEVLVYGKVIRVIHDFE